MDRLSPDIIERNAVIKALSLYHQGGLRAVTDFLEAWDLEPEGQRYTEAMVSNITTHLLPYAKERNNGDYQLLIDKFGADPRLAADIPDGKVKTIRYRTVPMTASPLIKAG